MAEGLLFESKRVSDVLAELDFPIQEVGMLDGASLTHEVTRNRTTPVSPVVAHAFDLVVKQAFAPHDGSGDLNFPKVTAFNSN
jgi:hypothetical protein